METIASLKSYMEGLANLGYFNGAVLAAQNGQILLCEGYGMANFEHEVPNTSRTKFRIGSLTKGFTAMAIMQLQEQGKLALGDFIECYIPDYPNGDKITIRHLLEHSSGIPDYPGFPGYWETTMRLYSPIEHTIHSFKDRKLLHAPGERRAYGSSAYILLSAIIEKVSRESYAKYIADYICQPLQMNDSGCEDGRSIIKRFAAGYSVNKDIIPCEHVDMSIHLGAGGMYSTVEDLYKWDRSLYTEQLVRQASLDSMFVHPTPPCGSKGWVVLEQEIGNRKSRRISHFGSMNGFRSDMIRYVDEDIVVIVLSNVELTPVEIISQQLADMMLGREVVVLEPFHPVKISSQELQRYAGVYDYGSELETSQKRMEDMNNVMEGVTKMDAPSIAVGLFHKLFNQYGVETKGTLIVTFENGTLYLFMPKRNAWYKYEIVPISHQPTMTTGVTRYINEQVEFFVDPTGAVKLMHRDASGKKIVAIQI
ncbi:serine hydrolase domain-containing protein [Paenibacillus sp. UNC451MF]|uniref:serine hydrolase domain-containing protein n=1 Tax=Paenibacillus sp. UNC451MF TaxID=1449063 RepID=UPI00068ACFF6|nr:serine hydrolase domain-containing protein [Paenibacillus sp. UNC451MF]